MNQSEAKSFPTNVVVALISGYMFTTNLSHSQVDDLYHHLTGKHIVGPPTMAHTEEALRLIAKQYPYVARNFGRKQLENLNYQEIRKRVEVLLHSDYEVKPDHAAALPTSWKFKALPLDVSFRRILDEAPESARIVWVTVDDLRFAFIRQATWRELERLKLFPSRWRPLGCFLPRLVADVPHVSWSSNGGELDGWYVGVGNLKRLDTFTIDEARDLLAKLDKALAEEKANKDKLEVQVEAF